LFTAAFCQQGIQYFPDEWAALKEMRRVLENNGQLIMSVWGGASDFFIAMADSVSKQISADLGARYLAPFSYKNIEQLPEMLEAAEFKSVSVEEIIVDRVTGDPGLGIPKEILGHPAGQKVQEAGEEIIQAIANDVSVACARHQLEAGMVVPQRAFLIQAKAA
jgi:SAM-dependent methyltransferase